MSLWGFIPPTTVHSLALHRLVAIIKQNSRSQSSKVPIAFHSLNTISKSKISSGTQVNLLTVTQYTSKTQIACFNIQCHRKRISIPKGEKRVLWGKAGPKQNQNPAGQTPDSASPCLISKGSSALQSSQLDSLQHTSFSWAASTPVSSFP